MPVVTVGLPVYNAAPYLADTIHSVLNQTFQDWELLIVDDGSTDNSVGIARSFSDPRIKVIADGLNLGLPIRLNQISQLAQGLLIARMDADDIMVDKRLQVQIDYFGKHPEVDVVSSFIYTIDKHNKVFGIRGSTSLPNTLKGAICGVPIAHPTVMARKNWFLEHPYNPTNFRGQDIELWLSIIETAKFHVITDSLLFYREIGLPYTKKYLQTSQAVRTLLKKYSKKIGHRNTLLAFLMTYVKDGLYILFHLFNNEDWLLHRRSKVLTTLEQQHAQEMLTQSIQRNLTHRL
ncbi:glycosyltransferase [Larkinella humicola]|uniref:Glycosyltransferase n=1 Tax=Larkinella humicola TaxID=2607654 RepID=A0A5N1JGF2_9BACT|nr:glycosyltransferase [Larkinella humicola]KAA9349710.1 glycosyltransferase [Larkinella humicola]